MDEKEVDKENVMKLDPGPRRRTAASTCSCCVLGVLGFVAVVITVIFLLGYQLILAGVRFVREPHSGLYHNASAPDTPSIRPLVQADTTFDIFATVWVRAPRDEEREFYVQQADGVEDADIALKYDGVVPANVPYLLEYAVYSGVVFHGLRMHDTHVSAEVNFTFPTAHFRDKSYGTGDLRASFVLIPSPPSPLEYLVNFSTWVPGEISYWPMRPWPLPDAPSSAPISSGHLGDRSLSDIAIDSFGVSLPLLEIHEIASACVPRNSTETTATNLERMAVDEDMDEAKDEDKGEDKDKDDSEELLATMLQTKSGFHLFTNQEPHKKHPHVITRTQLRLVIEENVYNLTAYNEAHETLKAESCGGKVNLFGLGPQRNSCVRSYRSHGPLGTRLEIAKPGKSDSEWLYAPYLTPLANAAGPLDVIPIPVNRENCSANNMDTSDSPDALPFTDSDTMNVTLHISFSGRSTAKMTIADMLTSLASLTTPGRPAHNASMLEKQKAHETSEFANSLFGHRFYKDAHPRKRFFLWISSIIAIFIAPLFTLHYWYTCSSTIGLSLRGQWLAAWIGLAYGPFEATLFLFGTDGDAVALVVATVMTAIVLVQPLLMLKTLGRVEVGLTGWRPHVRRAQATHKERASARVDARTSWIAIATGSMMLLLAYWFVKPWQYAVLGSLETVAVPQEQSGAGRIFDHVAAPASAALQFVAEALQLVMNARARTFAGQSRAAVAFLLVAQISKYVVHVGLLGRYALRVGVSWDDVIRDSLLLTLAWQALTLPLVDQTAEDEAEK